jgi:hypothetical protein
MSGPRRLLLSGIALTALLALVAVASHAHHPGGGNGAGPKHPSTLVFDYLASTMVILLPIGAIICVWAYFDRRQRILRSGGTSWGGTLVLIAVVTPFLAAAFFITRHVFHGRQGSAAPPHLGQTAKAKTRPKPKSQPAYRAQFRWLPALVLGSLVVAIGVSTGAVYVRRWRAGDAWDDEAALAVALDEVLADTLDDLRAEGDPRRAVIRTYARMERTFAAYGVSREEAEAPQEYVERVLDRLQVSSFAVQRLARLFERAKFSEHEIDVGMKDDAIEALVGLRAELEYKPEAA